MGKKKAQKAAKGRKMVESSAVLLKMVKEGADHTIVSKQHSKESAPFDGQDARLSS